MPNEEAEKILAGDFSALGNHLGDFKQASNYFDKDDAKGKKVLEFILKPGAHTLLFSPKITAMAQTGKATAVIADYVKREGCGFCICHFSPDDDCDNEHKKNKMSKKPYMQAIDYKFSPDIPLFAKDANKPSLIRSGKSGNSHELLSKEEQATLDRFCQDELRRLGSDLLYRW